MVLISRSGVGFYRHLAPPSCGDWFSWGYLRAEGEIATLSKVTGIEQPHGAARLSASGLSNQNVQPKVLLTPSSFRLALKGGLLSKLSRNEKSI